MLRASQVLAQIKQVVGVERGIALREVARLNTRERLTATWFERRSDKPVAFTHKLWRMILKEDASEDLGKALLALINCKVTSYLVNLFSTNNDVSKDDLGRMPIPDPQTMPVAQLATLADALLSERSRLEQDFALKYHARLPRFDDGNVYVPPSAVLAQTRLPKLTLSALVGRGEVKNIGPLSGRIRALSTRTRSSPRSHPPTLTLPLSHRFSTSSCTSLDAKAKPEHGAIMATTRHYSRQRMAHHLQHYQPASPNKLATLRRPPTPVRHPRSRLVRLRYNHAQSH